MYLAEALGALGHDVTVINLKLNKKRIIQIYGNNKLVRHEIVYHNNIIKGEHLNVKYINAEDIIDFIVCDYIITTYSSDDLNILKKMSKFNKLIMIMNNPFSGENIEVIKNFDKNKIIIAYISNYSKDNILRIPGYEDINNYNNILIHNSIDLNDIKPMSEKENSFIFFACFERGYKMAVEVRNKFNSDFKMYTNTYSDNFREKLIESDNIIITENTSKNTIFEYCKKSKYFVYSLINLDNNKIHCDTFAYVILEALLHGVVVLAPRLLLFEELYGDAICYIETDDIIPRIQLTQTDWQINNANFGLPIVDRYVDKLNLLEKDKELYNSYVQKGLLLKDKFDNKKIVNVLLDAIN
jgi:glycosyltransferase involved in cell wall biosynthesis